MGGMLLSPSMITAVAAAASVPDSSTFTKAWCRTSSIQNGPPSEFIPEKSAAAGSKATSMPRLVNTSFRLKVAPSSCQRGMVSSTWLPWYSELLTTWMNDGVSWLSKASRVPRSGARISMENSRPW